MDDLIHKECECGVFLPECQSATNGEKAFIRMDIHEALFAYRRGQVVVTLSCAEEIDKISAHDGFRRVAKEAQTLFVLYERFFPENAEDQRQRRSEPAGSEMEEADLSLTLPRFSPHVAEDDEPFSDID